MKIAQVWREHFAFVDADFSSQGSLRNSGENEIGDPK